MPLVPISDLVARAQQGRYAIGYFESWNLESLAGVIDAAEQTNSPIIIGFNGEFLSAPERRAPERLQWYAALGRAAAESAAVPCGLIFNECPRDDWVLRAADAGFNLVMLADPAAPYDDYVRRVAKICSFAHGRHVAVEAELGHLPCGVAEQSSYGSRTDPERAADLVERTGTDLLAVSVGNVHIQVDGESDLDLDLLDRIHRRVPTPLVLHGGTGIRPSAVRQAVLAGVVKVNYGTYLKQRYLEVVCHAAAREPRDPHALFGIGGEQDVMVAARLAVRDAVLERIELLGCCGRA